LSEYAPAAIRELFDQIDAAIPNAVLSGIQGDSAHTYGYHRGRNYLPGSDYSVQQSDDKKGSGEAASALDVSLNDSSMQTVTRRLVDAVDRHDERLLALREFYGTLDGRDVTGRDVRTGHWITSDDSHLWHIHLSLYRRWADDYDTLSGIGEVITGVGAASDDDPPWEQLMAWYGSKGEYENKMFSLMTSAVQQFLKYGPDGHTYGFDTLLAKRIGPVEKKVDTVLEQTDG
jgi:hypothetical protein